MTQNYAIDDSYRKIAGKVIEEHEDLHWIRSNGVRIAYIRSSKQKATRGKLTYAECMKVKEIFQLYAEYDFFIVIYAPNVFGLDEEQMEILLYHELLHIGADEDKEGNLVYKVNPHDIEDFKVILERYGIGWAKPKDRGD